MAVERLEMQWNEQVFHDLFLTHGGATGEVLRTAGTVGTDEARRLCPVSEDGSHGRPPGYLRDGIVSRIGYDSEGPYVDVVSTARTPDGFDYGLAVEFGTAPHPIDSRGPWPLRDRHGRVFGRHVDHPGTQPQPFLRPSIEAVRRALQ